MLVGIVYLNYGYEGPGTNLYTQIEKDYTNVPEHEFPWRSRIKYEIDFQIKANYNSFVLFDGNILHGAAIEDESFFLNERMNLSTFVDNAFLV